MIDPVTAIGLATGAFNSIKTMISTGKDIQDMAGQLGQWGKAISDLDFAAAKADKPPWYKKLGGGIQANAMEVWIHKRRPMRCVKNSGAISPQYTDHQPGKK